jgi:hypothetical protein
MAEHVHTTPTLTVRRRAARVASGVTSRKEEVQAPPANVVPFAAPPASPSNEDIVAAVRSKTEHKERTVLSMLRELNADLDRQREADLQHRSLPIGRALQGQDFVDWLEVGQRMLARRRRQ